MSDFVITVLGSQIRVLFVDALEGDEVGTYSERERIIRILRHIPHDVQVETFYHELVHCMMSLVGTNLIVPEAHEELICQSLGYALARLVSDNTLPAMEGKE